MTFRLSAQTPSGTDFEQLLHRAFDFHRQGDYAQALPLLRGAWTLEPHDYFVNLLLGIDLLRTGKPADAVNFLRSAVQAKPKEEFPYEYLGEAQAALHHYPQAAEAYAEGRRVAAQSPQSAVAYVDFALARFADLSARLRSSRAGLAAEYRLQGLAHPPNSPERLQLLDRAATLDGEAPAIWGDLALAQLSGGREDDAAASVAKALKLDSNDLRGQEAAARLAAQRGDWAETARYLNEIAQRSPTALSQALAVWPATLLPPQAQKMSGAAKAFVDCVAQRCAPDSLRKSDHAPVAPSPPSSQKLFKEQRWELFAGTPAPTEAQPQAWLQRGIAFAQLDQCEHAIPALERGIAGTQPDVYGSYLLTKCYARQAGAVAEAMAKSGDDDASLHLMRGDVLLRLQADSVAAIAEYQAALSSNDHDPAVLQRLADAQLAAGQVDAARASAETALKIDPHRSPAMRTLAKIAMQQRDYHSALRYLRPLAESDPSDLGTQVDLGTACAQTGEFAEALKNLQPALEKGYPDEKGNLHYQLGAVLRKLGRAAEANAAFVAARELSDNFQRSSHQNGNQSAGDRP